MAGDSTVADAVPRAAEPIGRAGPSFRHVVILGGASLLFYAAFAFRASGLVDGTRYFPLFDDAMVSMRFARNLVRGAGLVFNPGETPVEGYTNFLWTLWMAALHLASSAPWQPSFLVILSGIAILGSNALLVYRMTLRLSVGSSWSAFVALGLVLFHYPLVYWTLRGMEVGAIALAVNVALYQLIADAEHRSWSRVLAAAAALSVAVLIRTDALVAATVIAAGFALSRVGGRGMHAIAIVLAPVALTFAAHTWFRVHYYGDALPNTYYLKVSGVPFAERLARGLSTTLFTLSYRVHLLVSLAISAVWLSPRKSVEALAPLLTLIAAFVAQAAYSSHVGGDAWEWMLIPNRYLSVATPGLFVAAAVGLERLVLSARDAGRTRVLFVACRAALLAAIAGGLWEGVTGPTPLRQMGGLAACVVPLLLLASYRRTAAARISTLAGTRGAWLALAALLVLFEGIAFAGWTIRGAYHASDDLRETRAGLALRRLTPPDTVLAVAWAGTLPYYAERPVIDMLGKCDRRIAHSPPSGAFVPGHNKWDYRYSIGELRPDIVTALWNASADDLRFIRARGYVELENGWLVRRESRIAPPARLELGGL